MGERYVTMETRLAAIEVTGTVDEHRRLQLDSDLPILGPARVRVIILYPFDEELSEAEWLETAARNPAFAYLQDPEEDVYTLADGKPFYDQV